MQRIAIKLSNCKYLVAESNVDPIYNREIFIAPNGDEYAVKLNKIS